jgi:hypothetical protein
MVALNDPASLTLIGSPHADPAKTASPNGRPLEQRFADTSHHSSIDRIARRPGAKSKKFEPSLGVIPP